MAADVQSPNVDPAALEREYKRPPSFWQVWQKAQGIPIYDSFHVADLMTVELQMWDRFGVPAAFMNLADPFVTTAIALEIPEGGATKPIQHMFETWVYIVKGRGETLISQEGVPTQTARWHERSVFGPPLNTTYQHKNTGSGPVRILMVTNAPLTMSLYHSEKYVFENKFVFEDRYNGEQGYFNAVYDVMGKRYVRTNMVDDARDFRLHQWDERGSGNRTIFLSMSHHTIGAHISEFEPRSYKKAHRHGPGAHVIVLRGEGYSLCWPEGKEPIRVDWRENSMFSPPDMWFHQHFNTSNEPARYLALKSKGSPEHPMKLGLDGPNADPETMKHHQIEHDNEAPWIYEMFERELQAKGITVTQPRPNYRKT
jgi:oxalate decarboxylase/phosphoglucose isomerase-like protein (cupin superfamily)